MAVRLEVGIDWVRGVAHFPQTEIQLDSQGHTISCFDEFHVLDTQKPLFCPLLDRRSIG